MRSPDLPLDRPRHRLIFGLLLLAVGAVAYLPSLSGPFVHDDRVFLVGNPALRDPWHPIAVLGCGHQETRPLTLYGFALCFAVGGGSPLPFRLLSLALHLSIALLVYALGRFLARDLARRGGGRPPWRWLPEVAALLFVVHPLATENVAYVSALAGLLAAFFGLASLNLYLRFEDGEAAGGNRWLAYAASLGCLLAAVLSKESGAITPLLIALYLLCFRRRGPALRQLRPLLPHLLVAPLLTWLLLRTVAYPHGSTFGLDLMPWSEHLLTQTAVLTHALRLMLWPFGLNFDYEVAPLSSPWTGRFLMAALVWLLLGLGAWKLRARLAIAPFALLWAVISLAPTNLLVQFRDFFAERHAYLGLVGFALAGAEALGLLRARLEGRPPVLRWVPGLVSLGLAFGLALLTAHRGRVLADPVALWRDAAAGSPAKLRPRLNLALTLLEAGRQEEGLAELQGGLAIAPDDADLHLNLGVYHQRQGQLEPALHHLRRAAQARASVENLRALSKAAVQLGVARYRARELTGAADAFAEAIRATPGRAAPHYNLGLTLIALGDREGATLELQKALSLQPGHLKARARLRQLQEMPPR